MGGYFGSARSQIIGPVELRLAVVATLMEPALHLAAVLRLPLEDVETLARTGYVRVGKERGLSVRAMARAFKCATATIQSIATRSRARALPGILGLDVDRKRRLVALAGQGPFSLDDAVSALGHERDVVALALEELEGEARLLTRDGDTYRLARSVVNYVEEDSQVRLGALRQLLAAVSETVYARFFRRDSSAAFVRTVSFSTTAQDLDAVRDDVWKTLEPRVRDADARATPTPKSEATAVFLVVASVRDGLWRARAARARPHEED